MSKAKSVKVDGPGEVMGLWELTGPAGDLRFKFGSVATAACLYAAHFTLDPAAVAADIEAGRITVGVWNERSEGGGSPGGDGPDGGGDVPA